jgi:hypothetical protein
MSTHAVPSRFSSSGWCSWLMPGKCCYSSRCYEAATVQDPTRGTSEQRKHEHSRSALQVQLLQLMQLPHTSREAAPQACLAQHQT